MRTSALLLVPFFILIQYANATSNGIVGFGIDIYPDLCCQSCRDSLSALYLSCTTFPDTTNASSTDSSGMKKRHDDGSMDADMPMTSDACRASSQPWLQTMAYCIQQNCNAVGFGITKQVKCFSKEALAGGTTPTFQESLPKIAPSVELAKDAVWLNSTSLVNSELYYDTYGTYAEFGRSENLHTKYSVALILLVIGVVLVSGITNQFITTNPGLQKQLQSSRIWSKLRQHLFLPALVGSRHLQPLPGRVGYVPSRMLSINIGIYVILNIIFSSVSFSSFQPNTAFFSWQFEICEYVGNRTGTLSLVNTAIAILFAGRNNLLISLTGWSQTTFLALHRWSARVATVQAIVHSVLYTVAYWEPGYAGAATYAAQAAMPFFWWGIIATIAYALATSLAILPLRAKAYDTFLAIHIGFAILALVGCWYHLVPHFGLDYGYQVWLYLAFAFWSADRLARLVRLAYYNRLGSSEAIVEAVPGCDVFQITVFPRTTWGFGPGQHSFLYFPWIGAQKFWESHPFSIAKWAHEGLPSVTASGSADAYDCSEDIIEPDTLSSKEVIKQERLSMQKSKSLTSISSPIRNRASIQLLVRGHTGMTADLRKHMSLYSRGSSMDISVYNEGPYGGHRTTLQPFQLADTMLCLVGGIGITHALGFIQEFVSANSQSYEETGSRSKIMRKAKRLILAWSARELALIEHVRRNFLVECEGAEYLFWCTGDSLSDTKEAGVAAGRMDIASVVRSSVETGHQTTVLACGPGSLADEARQQVINCVRDGFRVNLVEESFCW
ncbi:ferric reductase like transmembrane component-domain-containing protein [Xylaria sp. FL1042]|nr:ferric reductase like transmembrane component-domain-containing protein [Xylaria sp. FL1042]